MFFEFEMHRPLGDVLVPGIIGRKHLHGREDLVRFRRIEHYRLLDRRQRGQRPAAGMLNVSLLRPQMRIAERQQ